MAIRTENIIAKFRIFLNTPVEFRPIRFEMAGLIAFLKSVDSARTTTK